MLLIWIPIALIILSVLALLVIAIRKVPYLRAIDTSSTREAKVHELKQALVAKRLTRLGEKYFGKLKIVLRPLGRVAKLGANVVTHKVLALEEHYQKLRKEAGVHAIDTETRKKMLEEAGRFVKETRYGEAEKRLIEILSHDPRNVEAYEVLGDLYLKMKNYDQAEETFKFILKIQPNDASTLTGLGEIELARGKPAEAKGYFEKAVAKRPNNPKYLDFLVEANILTGSAADARRALEQLRAANPENKKLEEFEERIDAIEKK